MSMKYYNLIDTRNEMICHIIQIFWINLILTSVFTVNFLLIETKAAVSF